MLLDLNWNGINNKWNALNNKLFLMFGQIYPNILDDVDPVLRTVGIEITNRCNLKCKSCFSWKRDAGDMTFNSFTKIVDELDSRVYVGLNYAGESFLNPDFPLMVKYAHEKFGKKHLVLTTNGMLFDNNRLSLLLNYVGNITVSLDGLGAVNDDLRVGSRFDLIDLNIKNLMALKGDNRIVVNLTRTTQSDEQIQDFINYWRGKVDVVRTKHAFDPELNLMIDVDVKQKFCKFPFKYMGILWNGDVVPCCNDFAGDHVLGNVLTHDYGVYGVWSSKEFKLLRKSLILDHYFSGNCGNCSAWKSVFGVKEFVNKN